MIRHLVLTDVRRFRWPLLAWCALVAVYTSLLLLEPASVSETLRYQRVDAGLTLLGISLFIATMVLAALLIQGDTTISTDAFWLTRPIPPLQLLTAKALVLAAAVLVLPGLVEIVVMAASHMPPAAIVRVAAESTASGLFWLALFMAGAAMTRNLGALALMWLGIIVAAVAIMIGLSALLAGRMTAGSDGGMAFVSIPPGMSVTSQAVWSLGLTLAFAVVLLVQYRRRSRLLAVAAGSICGLAAFFAAAHWPFLFLEPRPLPLPAWASGPGAIRLTAASPVARLDDRYSRPWQQARMPIRVDGVDAGWVARASLIDATVTARGRTMETPHGFRVETREIPFENAAGSPTNEAVRQLLSVARLRNQGDQSDDVPAIILQDVDPELLDAGAKASYVGRFSVELSRVDVIGTLPLTRGATIQDGAYRLRVEEASLQGNSLYVRTTRSWAKAALDRRQASRYELYAVNDAQSEAVYIAQTPPNGNGGDAALLFNAHLPLFGPGFSRIGLMTAPPDPLARNAPLNFVDAAWLAKVHLALVRWTPSGSVDRELSVPELTICTHAAPAC